MVRIAHLLDPLREVGVDLARAQELDLLLQLAA
jgi:hypothetical protein